MQNIHVSNRTQTCTQQVLVQQDSTSLLCERKQLMEKEEDILGRNFSYIMKNLRHTHARTDQETFMRAARMIADPEGNLFIMAQRTSYGLGYLLHVLLTLGLWRLLRVCCERIAWVCRTSYLSERYI